jgi:hypothetical protein
MGKIKKICRRVKKGSRKIVKPLVSATVGGTIGFFVGGPVGAIVGAISSTVVSVDHKRALAVNINLPFNPPPINKNKHKPTRRNVENQPIFVPFLPAKQDLEQLEQSEQLEQLEQSEQLIADHIIIPANNDTKDKKEKDHGAVLRTIGIILEKSVIYKEKWDEGINGPSGPRYILNKSDPIDITHAKASINNILDRIETEVGNDPGADIANGTMIKYLARKVKKYENSIRTKTICPVCNGIGKLNDGRCNTCGGDGYVFLD